MMLRPRVHTILFDDDINKATKLHEDPSNSTPLQKKATFTLKHMIAQKTAEMYSSSKKQVVQRSMTKML